MSKLYQKSLVFISISTITLLGLIFTFGLLDAESQLDPSTAPQIDTITIQNKTDTYPIISDTIDQNRPEIHNNCLAYRGEDGNGVYLHNLITEETVTINQQNRTRWRAQGCHFRWHYRLA